eukprot:s5237_g2.t1
MSEISEILILLTLRNRQEQIGVLPESSETRGFFETLGQAASLVSRGQLLRRHEHWQPCTELSLAACCQREAVRVNDGAGRCRCAQAAEQAELCALEWQRCELPREACCQSLPAMMLVAFGNSSASGYSASCACAPMAFGPLNQLQLEQRCAEGNGNGHKACKLLALREEIALQPVDLRRLVSLPSTGDPIRVDPQMPEARGFVPFDLLR